MIFKKKKNKNTNSQDIPTQNMVFIFIYKGIGKGLIETDTIVAKYEHEAIEQFKTKHPNNELFAYKYDFVDQGTGETYTSRKNWEYAEYLYRLEKQKTIKSLRQAAGKKQNKSDSDINLKPLYYKENGDYHKTGLYVDPSKLHELFSNLTKETD
jgi:hypothetical protein|nr:MAG TPA: hypothetical protein [Bacteriophage sp.]